MPRTPEQKAADEAMREAVQRQREAYGYGDGVIVDMVVVGSVIGFDEDGDEVITNFATHDRDNIPLYRLLGLCEYAATVYRHDIAARVAQ